MFCHNCGAELPDDALYCFKCGERMENRAEIDEETAESFTFNYKDSKAGKRTDSKNKQSKNAELIVLLMVTIILLAAAVFFFMEYKNSPDAAEYSEENEAENSGGQETVSLINEDKPAEITDAEKDMFFGEWILIGSMDFLGDKISRTDDELGYIIIDDM